MPKAFVDLVFPVAGLDRRGGYQRQRPFTTDDALNVRPYDVIEGRGRGGSRPGLQTVFSVSGEPLGTPASREVRMLEMVNVASSNARFWRDGFDGDELGSVWSNEESYNVGQPPTIGDGYATGTEPWQRYGAVRNVFANIDTTSPYTVSMFIVPEIPSGRYAIPLRMNDSEPDSTHDSIIAYIWFTLAESEVFGYSAGVVEYQGGISQEQIAPFTQSPLGDPGWFSVTVNDNNITLYWKGSIIPMASYNASDPVGSRIGFWMEPNFYKGGEGVIHIDEFRVEYSTPAGDVPESTGSLLVASAGEKLYKEDRFGVLSHVSTQPISLADDATLHGADYLGRLYIADHGFLRINGSDGTSIASDGKTITSDTAGNWLQRNIDIDNDVLFVTEGTGAVNDGVYRIEAVNANTLTLVDGVGGTGTFHFRVERPPKVYDPVTNILELWIAEKNLVPIGCPLISRFLGRVYLAGASHAPDKWFACRVGDPLDWDYGDLLSSDTEAAVYSDNTEAGDIGEPMSAMIPHTKDYQIMAGLESMWAMRGDPAFGGRLDNLSRVIGIIGADAWCWTPEGHLACMSRDGVYLLPAGAMDPPQSVSRDRLPREMIGASRSPSRVLMPATRRTTFGWIGRQRATGR
jgi:hypothetical protein